MQAVELPSFTERWSVMKPATKTPETIEFISDLLTKFETPDFSTFADWPSASRSKLLRLGDFIAYKPFNEGKGSRRVYQIHEVFPMGEKDALYGCVVVWHDGDFRVQKSTIRHSTVQKMGGAYRVYTPVSKALEPVATVQADEVLEGKSVAELRKRADLAEKRQVENNEALKAIAHQARWIREAFVTLITQNEDLVTQNKELVSLNKELIELVKKAWG